MLLHSPVGALNLLGGHAVDSKLEISHGPFDCSWCSAIRARAFKSDGID